VTYLLLGTQPPMPKLTSPRWIAGTFSAWIASQPGRLYRLEYKTPATATNWLPLSLVPGNGASQVLTDPGALPGERYYRARRY
jgi:hypothetical protein